MAVHSLLTLLDDIATLLDDVSTMAKVAAKKTAGVVGDDLALNAEQVTGFGAERELPVVWAVAKGSLVNKAILVPAALAISAFVPALIRPLLMIGGAYLCFEGSEKILHKLLAKHDHDAREDHTHPHDAHAHAHGHDAHGQHTEPVLEAAASAEAALAAIQKHEQARIRGAIRTDFVLSAEIIVIALGVVSDNSIDVQVLTLSIVAVLITIAVYGLVGLIVKLDDAGIALGRSKASGARGLGLGLLWLAPRIMKSLTWIGTVAMFLVGGGIIVHGLPPLAHLGHSLENMTLGGLWAALFGGAVGVATGLLLVGLFAGGKRAFGKK